MSLGVIPLPDKIDGFVLKSSYDRLQAENTKLRELVVEMFNACPMCVNCAHNHLTVGWYDRMRELGVEADE